MKRINPQSIALIVVAALVLIILILIGSALAGLPERRAAEQLEIAAVAIDRAARQCYALEGAYPPDLDYLEANYGLIIDRDNYDYYYEVVGANIRPIIEVQSK
ncbi:MAG: hypothetical protein ACOX1T_06430 [Saccharofermentanales bacterium]|jgi:type II secretory pathway pseudopilin PulG